MDKVEGLCNQQTSKCRRKLFEEDASESLEARVGKVRSLFSQVLGENPITPGLSSTQTPLSMTSATPISVSKPVAGLDTLAKRQIAEVISGNKELSEVLREADSGHESKSIQKTEDYLLR